MARSIEEVAKKVRIINENGSKSERGEDMLHELAMTFLMPGDTLNGDEVVETTIIISKENQIIEAFSTLRNESRVDAKRELISETSHGIMITRDNEVWVVNFDAEKNAFEAAKITDIDRLAVKNLFGDYKLDPNQEEYLEKLKLGCEEPIASQHNVIIISEERAILESSVMRMDAEPELIEKAIEYIDHGRHKVPNPGI